MDVDMYGTRLPEVLPEFERFRTWLLRHAAELELPVDGYRAIQAARTSEGLMDVLRRDSSFGAPLGEAIVSTVGEPPCLSAVRREDGEAVGVIAAEVYPWTAIPGYWSQVTRESVEEGLRGPLRELFGGCFEPRFDYLDATVSETDPVARARATYARMLDDDGLRDMAPGLWEWLGTTDYMTAPASTSFHCAYPGGLLVHSVNVAEGAARLMRELSPDDDGPVRRAALCGLVHDVCKLGAYDVAQDGTVTWHRGHDPRHGDLSRELVLAHADIDDDMALAIEWHMGFFDRRLSASSRSAAATARETLLHAIRTPLVNALMVADYEAAWFGDMRPQRRGADEDGR